jgi:hypothetical protein
LQKLKLKELTYGLIYEVVALEALTVIARNFPGCPEWDHTSFLGRLCDDSTWSRDEYWLLERALHQLVAASAQDSELHWRVFRIFSLTSLSISAHLDRNDSFKVKNLKQEELYAFRERVQLVFEGFFSGEMPALSECFEEINPLLSAGLFGEVR